MRKAPLSSRIKARSGCAVGCKLYWQGRLTTSERRKAGAKLQSRLLLQEQYAIDNPAYTFAECQVLNLKWVHHFLSPCHQHEAGLPVQKCFLLRVNEELKLPGFYHVLSLLVWGKESSPNFFYPLSNECTMICVLLAEKYLTDLLANPVGIEFHFPLWYSRLPACSCPAGISLHPFLNSEHITVPSVSILWKSECTMIKTDCKQMLDDKEVLSACTNCNLFCEDFVTV